MQYLTHVNTLLGKMRQEPITDLSTDQTTDAFKAQVAVQRAVARIWNFKTWSFKRRSKTLSLTSGTADYELPKNAGEIYSITLSEAPYVIQPVAKYVFDRLVLNPIDTGNPSLSMLSDYLGVSEQPTAASTISVVSSSSLDNTQSVLIQGLVSGEDDYEVVSLNGTSAATTSKSFTHIESVTKSEATAGRVTLTSDSGGVTNLVLGPNELTTRLRKITFFPEPASSLTATLNFFALPPNLTHKWQDTLIPDRWAYVIDQWAFALGLQPKGQEQQAEQTAQLATAIKMLEEDMASEEIISIEEPMVSLKPGQGSGVLRAGLPSGYGHVE